MSYCVRCGVELAPSEKSCPLCLAVVLDPNGAPEAAEQAYPERLETVNTHIDHRYGAKLATLFLSIPMGAVLILDLLISGRVTWSGYVIGAGICICLWVILPFFLEMRRPYLYIAIDVLSASAYLAFIAWRVGGMNWYTAIALPLTLLVGLTAILCVYIARRKRMPTLHKVASMVWAGAGALVGLEALIDLFVLRAVHLQWSIYAMVSLAAFGAIFIVIESNPRLKENMKRRLYL
ncbi:MAG: DUF6320 domain-containing protein [Christensenellales bacterium]|jgi:hypothetical protein